MALSAGAATAAAIPVGIRGISNGEPRFVRRLIGCEIAWSRIFEVASQNVFSAILGRDGTTIFA